MQEHLSRRDIIKTILVASATSIIGNKVWAGKTVSDVRKARGPDPTLGIARIQLADFPPLATNGGSVRIGSSDVVHFSPEQILPEGLFYPIIINRISATEYVALEANCTHAGCVPNALTGGLTGRIHCDCHGSEYDIRGNVTRAPASFPLLKYSTTLKGGVLIIRIPDQGFDIQQTSVLNGAEKRLKLSWTSFGAVEYEVRWRPNFSTEPSVVIFSSTLNGPVTDSIITGNDDIQSVFIVPTDGFYQVAIHHRPV